MKPLETNQPKIERDNTRIVINGGEMAIDVNKKELAALFAAAPDMLDALLRLTHPMADDEDLEFAFTTIAKARGFAPTDFEDVRQSCHEKCAADAIGGHPWANR
jgi:hypothetical protein